MVISDIFSNSNRRNSFCHGIYAMISIEVGMPSPMHLYFDKVVNKDLYKASLDLQEERHASSQLCLIVYQRKMAGYYNSKVKNRGFQENDFILKKVFFANREVGDRTLGPD
ncbi:Uncharacterized protein Adt_31123 [Abeliophyllum distichum]|uniref:Uncharacterized protein n=1 Tax=Abeliophyllum distichum TaxID=126358 RepID=A0ABD1REG8_9LAMI